VIGMIGSRRHVRKAEPLVRDMGTEAIRHLVGSWRLAAASMGLAGRAPRG
jgi:hypothetical protein